ncbi:MAG TPA: argininosuccinate lyase [Acidimicrobiales bacterium]|nr:argininosuccinate lyase [Acidimicrobiales bacterium]
MTLWGSRMGVPPAEEMMAFTASLSFDRRLAASDIEASIAHVHGLAKAGIVELDEAEQLVEALQRTGDELSEGVFEFQPDDEDIHTAIERRVRELVGDLGAKLHTGRSRNDQVATALRLYTREQVTLVAGLVIELQRTLLRRAAEAGHAYLPGYTHLQRAQPILLAHHLLAHGWAFGRDVDRLFATLERLNCSPLGAGALAGSSLPLVPDEVAAELAMTGRFENSVDAVADRDFVAETLFDLALLGVHLSRLGEEIVLFSTEEFGFVRLDDAWATGSSMLPQKKNPDVAELARGKAGRLIGHLAGFLATLKGLPLSYNRDLQEDKEPLFDAVDQVTLALVALEGLMSTCGFDTEAMQEAADSPTLVATDLAEWLVARQVSFREAHGIVGSLVRESVERKVPIGELLEAHPAFGEEALALLEPGTALRRRRTPGGSGPDAVALQMERFAERIESEAARLATWARR